MYNGIGLTTARGTATNGYVQRNVAYRRNKTSKPYEVVEYEAPKVRKPNQEILDHQRKRAVELKLLEWADSKGVYENNSAEEAENMLATKRKELQDLQNRGFLDTSEREKVRDSHQRSLAKEKEMEKFRRAMKINANYETGDAFKEDYQQHEKERKYEERLDREKQKYLQNKKRQEERQARRAAGKFTPSPERYSRRRSRSPSYRRRRSPSPRERKRRRFHSPSPSRSRSPPRRRRRRDKSPSASRSRSPPRRRVRYSRSPPHDRSLSPHITRKQPKSPVSEEVTRGRSRSRSPVRRRSVSDSPSRSPKK